MPFRKYLIKHVREELVAALQNTKSMKRFPDDEIMIVQKEQNKARRRTKLF